MRLPIIVIIALVSFSLVNVAIGKDDTPTNNLDQQAIFFEELPTPQDLADILFKPTFRSVNGQQVKQPDLFALLIQFEYDSTEIMPESFPYLDSVGKMMNLEHVKNEALVIEGHTDGTGSEMYNVGLSERRADAIKAYLNASYSISPERMVTVGKGEGQLYNLGDPFDPRNRRAVFRPLSSVQVH